MHKLLLPAALLFVLSACATVSNAPPSSSRGGYTFDLSDQSIKPATPMVAKPISEKLFVIIDPAQVEDAFLIDKSKHGVTGFRIFLENSLRKTLSAFFSSLTFVKPGFTFPDTPHYVAQFKADRISVNNLQLDIMNHAVLEMNWAFAIRPSTREEYAFSFSGVAKSEISYNTLWIGCQQLMTSTMHGLLQLWSDQKVHQTLILQSAPKVEPPSGPSKKPVLDI